MNLRDFVAKNKLQLFLITQATFLMWFKIFGQSILGEGYYYFDPRQDFIKNGLPDHIMQYDNLARIIFDVLSPVFRDKIILYMGFEMLILLLLNIVFFKVLLQITKSKTIAFVSVFLFLSNYMASFEMIAIGNYQRFVQRVPNLIPLLLVFPPMYIYLKSGDRKSLKIAFALYFVSIFLGHFALFLVPIFLLYPPCYSVINREPKAILFKRVLLSSTLATIALLLISQDPHSPISIFEFFNEEKYLIQKLFIQLANTALPPYVLRHVAPISAMPGYVADMTRTGIGVLALFLIFGVKLIKDKKNIEVAVIYWVSLLSLPLMFFYNLWLYRTGIDPLTQLGNARFFYIPSFCTSIVWGVIITMLVKKFFKKNVIKVLSIILILYFVNNYYYVSKDIKESQYKSNAMNTYLKFIGSHINELKPNSAIVTPTSLSWPAYLIEYLTDYHTIKHIQFEPGWEKQISDRPKENTFVVGYDYKQDKVLDLTDNYRKGETIDYSNFR